MVFCAKHQKIMIEAVKLWIPGPQGSIFQHLLEPEAGPEGGIKNTNNVFQRASM